MTGKRLVGLLILFTAAVIGTLTTPCALADPAPSTWAQLRSCESSGNYTAVAANGHYGAYQFDIATWHSVGGTGDPSAASPAEQDYRALYLYRMRGWQPWQCARMLVLQPDADAASGRVPTASDAAKIDGDLLSHQQHVVHRAAASPWPGKVYTYGDCDPALRVWQLRMNTYGFTFEGTGCYYDKTKAAVLAVQRANGIRASGTLGPKTWRAAWEGVAPTR
jgi:hypothetical protein